jgi:hypothetical protein
MNIHIVVELVTINRYNRISNKNNASQNDLLYSVRRKIKGQSAPFIFLISSR